LYRSKSRRRWGLFVFGSLRCTIARACREAGIGPLSRPVIFLTEADEDQSHDDIRDALRDALKAEFPSGPGYYAWVVEMWDAEFVYEYETPGDTKLYSRPYSVDDDGEVTFGDAVEVERLTTFAPVTEAMREAKTKSEDGKKFPASDYAYVPDANKPSTWKLRLTAKPGGKPDSGIVGAAAAALGKGFRGQKVQIPKADLPAVKAKVRAAWKKANPDKEADEMPAGIKESSAETDVVGAIIPLIESSVRQDGTVPIKIIEPGWGSSAYYPADVLERDGPGVFPRGTHMNWDHQTEAEEAERPEGELNDLAAVLETDARWEPNNPNGPGLYADAKVFGPFDKKLNDLAPHIGTSIHTSGLAEADEHGNIIEGEREGREGPILTELLKTPFTSVDFVTRAGAGGAVLQLFESVRPKSKVGITMPEETVPQEAQEKLAAAEAKVTELEAKEAECEEDLKELDRLRKVETGRAAAVIVTEALKDKELPEVMKTRLVEELSEDPPIKEEEGEVDEEALTKQTEERAAEEAAYAESLTGAGQIRGMGGDGDGDEGRKKLEESVRSRYPDFTDEQVSVYVTGR